MALSDSFFNLKQPDDREAARSLIACVLIVAGLLVLFRLTPPRDPSKVAANIPCSVLSENDIGAALGATMRLLPTDGTVCEYVSNGTRAFGTLFVVAKSDAAPPANWGASVTPVARVGDAALQHGDSLYVRFGARAYLFTIAATDPRRRRRDERLLAGMVRREVIARTR